MPARELLSEACDVTVHEGAQVIDRLDLLEGVRDKEGLLCMPGDRIDKEVYDAGPCLMAVSTCSVGYDHIDVAEATRRGIYVGHTPGVLTDATADLAFALLLTAARRVSEGDRYVRAGRWRLPFELTFMLGAPVWEATLGIVGFGRIGRAVAIRAEGFRMKVLCHDADRSAGNLQPNVEYRDLDTLLAASDFVSLHVPYSAVTHHLIGERELKLMKQTAILINTSRGAVVDEQALAAALRAGAIAGAGLDVYEREPLDAASPLIHMENVTLSPHIASATAQTRSRMAQLAAENLLAALRGEAPPRCVNPEAAKVRSHTF